jgi:uncharacterized membrane protein (DUF2068 family)
MADTPTSSSPSQPATPTAQGSVPGLVKAIAILNYIGAAFLIILALICFMGGSMAATLFADMNNPQLTAMTGSLLIFAGIVCIIGAALDIVLGVGLWKGKNWARILGVVLAAINIIGGLIMLPFGIVGIILHGLIGAYLLFNAKVKAAFH